MSIKDHYNAIRKEVSSDVWERIKFLQPKTKVDFLSIYGMGPVTVENVKEHIEAIENEYKTFHHSDLQPELKTRLEILRDKLINISQRNNIIWNSKESKNRLIDISKLSESSIEGINKLIQENSGKSEIKDNNLSPEDNKKLFVSLYRENLRQKKEKGKSSLYIAPALILGKTKVEQKDVKLRAPLFLFPVNLKLDRNTDKWFISIDNGRDVITNPFVEKYILKDANGYNYDLETTLEENITRLINMSKKIQNQFTSLQTFTPISSKDPWGYNKGEFAITNNLLLGLFSEFSNEIEAELDGLIYNMDSTPMLNKFLSNADFHSRHELNEINKIVEGKMNNDSDISYSNKLNEQQLRAVKLINEEEVKGLTIWGPPGTGKSETIISLIQNEVSKGGKVAIVSEKQAALDVIKNRDELIKNNSIMISDTKDKLSFFSQLSNMLMRDDYQVGQASKQVKSKLNRAYKELDSIYDKFGYNNKNVFEQIELLFNEPLYETTLSKRMQYEDEFFHFRNIDLETFNQVYDFIESIDSRDRLKLLITVTNNYYGKFSSSKDIEDYIAESIRNEIKVIEYRKQLLRLVPEIENNLRSLKGILNIFKKSSYKKNLYKMNRMTKQDVLEIEQGTFAKTQSDLIEKSNEYKDSLIKELEWVETRRYDVDVCLSMVAHNLNLIRLVEIDDIHSSKEAIKINLIRRLLKSDNFHSKLEILRNYELKIKEIKELQSEFSNLSEDELKISFNNSLHNVTLNKRENNMIKLSNRKRLLDIKKFINDYSIEMKNLVNIWLLQPEVVPTLFEIHDKFDLVIFDEASQIFLERSLPIIARANKIVVLGDEKQLGPSSFFAGRISTDEDEDEIIENNESLLTYSRSKLPEVMLKKHYRSKDIGLIEFSNDRYYDGELNFIDDNKNNDDSLEYHYVETPDYNNGLNKAEAQKVIDVIYNLKESGCKDSIGIITANQKQEVFLFNEFMTKHYELYEWLEDHDSFIKSIENVQGDEKDIIILSTTYGPKDGVQGINFGPINQTSGSNRINVAITRAKKKMIIVSSIDLVQAKLKVKSSLHQGPKDFVDFIDYVKTKVSNTDNKQLEVNELNNNTMKDSILKEIKEICVEKGYNLSTSFKGIGLEIDGVVVDESNHKKLFAIMIDSPQDERKAREKDYQNQEFLESRGWIIHRIWTPNWLTRNSSEIEKIQSIISSFKGEINE